MTRRLSMFEHLAGAVLFLLSLAFAVTYLDAAARLVAAHQAVSRGHAMRLHRLALARLADQPQPESACALVGPYFPHSAIVGRDRTVQAVCSGREDALRSGLARLNLGSSFAPEDQLLEAEPFGGGRLLLAAPVRSATTPDDERWLLAVVDLPPVGWSALLGHGAWLFLLFFAFAVLLVWWKTHQVSDDAGQLTGVIAAFRQGRLDTRPPTSAVREVHELSEELRLFAQEMEAQLALMHKERNELNAVFGAMTEGVVVLDRQRRVTRMNRQAQRMFQTDPAGFVDRSLIEVIRHAELEALVSGMDAAPEAVQRDLAFDAPRQRVLQVHCSRILTATGTVTGTLLVFTEVTRLRRLENMRREFSSNVSHELKTPITSIIGFIETLREEDPTATPDQRDRYLEVISRQAGRLHAIVEDLLNLSRIELITDPAAAGLTPVPLGEVMDAAVGMCAQAARERDIHLVCEPPPALEADLNASLFEQALVNIIDNAVKYSPAGSEVRILAAVAGDELRIAVRDHGCGIPEKDLPHIFERFYRVDKGRSRKQGGTGLGLSIAWHIMQVHRGRIDVESRPEEGSTFTLALPLRARDAAREPADLGTSPPRSGGAATGG